MDWSPQQIAAIEAVRAWYPRADRQQVFRLFGYAGTGKTTLAIHLARMLNVPVKFASFTGKASLVMKRKGCVGAQTIHSLIYKVRELPDGTVTFEKDKESELVYAGLLIIDECSMVGDEIAKDLLSFGVPILVLGDPAQLPPVKDAGYFTEGHTPDVMLTEIHRQAAGNPIINLATEVRQGGRPKVGHYKTDMGAVSVVKVDDLSESSMLGAEQILCGRNATRRSLNARMRTMLRSEGKLPKAPLNVDAQLPVVGDRVICLRNKKDRGLFNGGIFHVLQVNDRAPDARKPGRDDISYLLVKSLDVPDFHAHVSVPHAFWKGTDDKLDLHFKKNYDEFDFAYAITCHKSQGSQWDKVLVYDEGHVFGRKPGEEDQPQRWLYTAITRAADKLIVAI